MRRAANATIVYKEENTKDAGCRLQTNKGGCAVRDGGKERNGLLTSMMAGGRVVIAMGLVVCARPDAKIWLGHRQTHQTTPRP